MAKKSGARQAIAGVCVLFCSVLMFAPRTAMGPLRHWDEAWYAQVGREMLEAGDYLTPRWNGEPWFHKPPLGYWGTILSYRLFGVSETSARLFSVSCGVLVAGLIAAFVAGRTTTSTGVFAGLLLLACPDFVRYAGRGQLDGPVTLCVAIQLISFWKGLSKPSWHWVGGIAFGLALLAKGAAAGLAPMSAVAFAVVNRDLRIVRQQSWWGGLLLGVALAAPWHLYEWSLFGQQFLNEYGARHFTQFFNNIYPGESGPPPSKLYYLEHFWRSAPWGLAMLAILIFSAGYLLRGKDAVLRFAAVWTLAMPIALSFARTKWSWYLVPMYPGAAIFTAIWLSRTIYPQFLKRRLAPLCAAAAAIVACEPFALPAKEGEIELMRLAQAMQAAVPPEGGLHTLQMGRVRHSVYPIAALFYSQRKTYAVHSMEELQRVLVGPRTVFLLARKQFRSGIDKLVGENGRVQELAAENDIALFRIDSRLTPMEIIASPSNARDRLLR